LLDVSGFCLDVQAWIRRL